MVAIPAHLKELLSAENIAACEAALAPPPARRAAISFEVEIEAAGDGTWTLRYDNGAVTAKKGFAKSPLVSVRVGRGGMPLLQEELQAAVDGFPSAPELRKHLEAVKNLDPAVAASAHAAVVRIAEGTAIHFEIQGAGSMSVARGPIDEATKELTVGLDAAKLRAVLQGAPSTSVSASLKGDRSVGTAVLSAMSPVLQKIQGR